MWVGFAPHLDFKEGRAKGGPATDDLEKANLCIFLRASSVLVEVGNDRLQTCRMRGGGEKLAFAVQRVVAVLTFFQSSGLSWRTMS